MFVCVMCVGPSPSKLPAREERFPAFYEWLRTHKAEFDKARQLATQLVCYCQECFCVCCVFECMYVHR